MKTPAFATGNLRRLEIMTIMLSGLAKRHADYRRDEYYDKVGEALARAEKGFALILSARYG